MKKNDELLKQARDRMSEAIDADRDNRLEDMDDLEKLVGKQWPEEIRAEREADGKPCLTMNRLPQFVRQVTGDIRRMNPAVKILPADDGASPETAEIIEGMIRQIEYASDASSVYEQTAESAAACSIGWFRILNDWVDDTSFEQELKIKRIRNSFSVYCDPSAEMPTREDAQYLFITESIAKDKFREMYPNASAENVEADRTTDGMENWSKSGDVIIAEYYWKEPVKTTIWQLPDGSVTDQDPAKAQQFYLAEPVGVEQEPARKRVVHTHKVMWAKISGQDVLEGPTEQPSRNIPVIAVTGEEWQVGERVHRSSVIRYAKDAQQMYNYWRSAQTEFAALQPKMPYMVTAKQVAGLETFWNEANKKNRPYLPYNPDEKAPPPMRQPPPMPSQAMFEQVMSAAEDLKATTGIYDAGLGDGGNEKSGVAIRQRQMESDTSTSIYSDNMGKAIAHAGRIMVDMIPKIYDTQRMVRVIAGDDEESMVPINGQMVTQNGPIPINDVTVGKYDVRVSVGPNYSTRRQETAEGMIEFVKAFPGAAERTADLVAKSMDWPDADKFAERLKPQGLGGEDMTPEEQQMMQAQMRERQRQEQFMQMMQELDAKKQAAEAAEAEADAQKAGLDVMDQKLELAMKSGQLNEAIGLIVQEQVTSVLQGMVQQGYSPQ